MKIKAVLASFLLLFSAALSAEPFKVLVVMSYEENFHWSKDIKRGVDAQLASQAELTYFYMNTKANRAGGEQKAEEAAELFQQLNPDGVITVDDNAQSMFVVPYLKDKTQTPVMFCGVNAEPEKYGYPNPHISGILERGHILESIAFLQQLIPEVRNVGFLTQDSPSGKALIKQVNKEVDSYSAENCGIEFVSTTDELAAAATKLAKNCQAVYIDGAAGIKDQQGRVLSYAQAFDVVEASFPGPIIGANDYHVKSGAFSAVIKTGYEQGETAAAMLLKAMRGTAVEDIPITRNFRGRRVLNANALKQRNITPRPVLLRGVELIRAQ